MGLGGSRILTIYAQETPGTPYITTTSNTVLGTLVKKHYTTIYV